MIVSLAAGAPHGTLDDVDAIFCDSTGTDRYLLTFVSHVRPPTESTLEVAIGPSEEEVDAADPTIPKSFLRVGSRITLRVPPPPGSSSFHQPDVRRSPSRPHSRRSN